MLKIAYSPIYHHPLPVGHRFPMEKYTLLAEQLLYEGTVKEENFFYPSLATPHDILLTHKASYWEKLSNLALSPAEIRKTGFPLSQELVLREQTINQGTIDCALYALQYGVAMNIAGGTHHAFADRGEGFCLLNDIAMAANFLLHHQKAERILIVDLDVHQGNGTAKIFQHEPRVFTFSMHGEKNYPLQKEQSDLDIPLKDGTDDNTYLSLLDKTLKRLFDEQTPDFVFFQSGVDVLETDQLGRLALSLQGCRQRDKMVFELCKSHRIPVVTSMGGGYSPKLSTIVEAHANTFRVAQEVFF